MNLIKIELRKQGRSQRWLSKKIEIDYVEMTNYCNNKRQPSIPTLTKIAQVLEVDVRDLIHPAKGR